MTITPGLWHGALTAQRYLLSAANQLGTSQETQTWRTWLQNPVILLCDEATSALDSRTEKQILQALQTLAHGRTSLFVAHRLSTAAQCDQIVVLEGVSCLSCLPCAQLGGAVHACIQLLLRMYASRI